MARSSGSKLTKTKKVIKFLENLINCYGVSKKTESNCGSALISKESKTFCESKNIEIQ